MTRAKAKTTINTELPALAAERAKTYADRDAALARGEAAPLPTKITNSNALGTYSGHELSAPAVRLGAADHMALPSRWFGTRSYRDGREVLV